MAKLAVTPPVVGSVRIVAYSSPFSCLPVPLNRGCRLRHLHQGNDPFLHSGSSRTTEEKYRQGKLRCPFDRSRDLLPYYLAHASHQELGITDTDYRSSCKYLTFPYRDCLLHSRFQFRLLQLILVPFIMQRILLFQVFKPWDKTFGVCHHTDPVMCPDTEVHPALIADILILHCLSTADHLLTSGTLYFYICLCSVFFYHLKHALPALSLFCPVT